ncbi:MAG: DUF354 domain-containing protein [Bacteroidales bacterium]
MRILIDIGHPAHVHIFKNFAFEMMRKGNDILFTCREKEFEIELLKVYGLNYISFGRKYNSVIGKIFGLVIFDLKELFAGLKFKPDLFLSHGSIYAAHASFLMQKPHITLEDTFNFEQIRLYLPFTATILTGDYGHPPLGPKEIQYSGYNELTYLHPNYFTADENVLNLLNVEKNEKYVILRFVAWNASHDFGYTGISMENKLLAIKEFEKYAKVFISSESELPEEIIKYKINIPPHKMHDVLSFAHLLLGESSTMAEECAMLGVPSVYLNQQGTYYTSHLEKKYSLVYNYTLSEEDQRNAIEKGIELLKSPDLKEEFQKRKQTMLSDKIDVTSFLIWFIESFPESISITKSQPEYQYIFKSPIPNPAVY